MSKPASGVASAAEHAKVIRKLRDHGLKVAEAVAVVGTGPNGRSRREVSVELVSWLRNRPKG
jgi:hypothetical protein